MVRFGLVVSCGFFWGVLFVDLVAVLFFFFPRQGVVGFLSPQGPLPAIPHILAYKESPFLHSQSEFSFPKDLKQSSARNIRRLFFL